MEILITQSDRQVVMCSDNIIFEDDVYYAWNNDKPHKVTRANTTNTLEIVTLPEDVELPDDDIFVSKYVYNEDGTFTVYEHWVEDEEE
tara:strand:- start:185 stop:448 length:264 start_codon:yes stop_codon:yes gene_type:complete